MNLLKRYHHAWVFLYGLIYMPWFAYLEKRTIPAQEYFIINSPLDKYIPFCEYFIIPYLFWFAFVAIGVASFFFTSRKEFYQIRVEESINQIGNRGSLSVLVRSSYIHWKKAG